MTPLSALSRMRSTTSVHPDTSSYQSLQAQVLAIVLGNLITITILVIVYYNVLVFGHYGSELIYAVLISEALFSTRQHLVSTLKHYTSADSQFSPRQSVFHVFSSLRGISMLSFAVLLLGLVFSNFTLPILLIFSTAWLLAVCDRHVLFLFRIHHALRISDETLVSLFICFFMLASVFVFLGSFLLLAIQDMALAVDRFAKYTDLLEDDEVRERLNQTLVMGRSHIDSIANSLSQQYESTPYRMAIKLTADVLSNLTSKLEGSSMTNTLSESMLVFDENLKDQFLSALYNSTALFPQAANVLISPLYVVFALFLNMGVAFLDFGVRASFFAGVLVYLVANPKSVLQNIMESLLSVFLTTSVTHSGRRTAHSNSDAALDDGIAEEKVDDNDIDDTVLAFKRFEDDLRNTFKAVFLVPISLAAANACATLTLFFAFNLIFSANLNLSYFAALISLFLTLIPVVSPFASCIPWVLVCSFVHNRHWVAFALLATHFLLFQWIEVKMFSALHIKAHKRKRDNFRSYITGLSFFFGITSMGLHGVVLGPLFVSFLYTATSTVLDQYRDVIHTKFEW